MITIRTMNAVVHIPVTAPSSADALIKLADRIPLYGARVTGLAGMKHIYEKDFRYVPSGSTDLKETFRRVRERQEKEAKEKAEKVQEIKPRVRAKNGL